MKVLLIEPKYRAVVIPHGLMKIATYHLNNGDEVKYSKGVYPLSLFNRFYPDIIYITSLFTYEGPEVIRTIKQCQSYYPKAELLVGGVFASLMPQYIFEQTGVHPHVGLLPKVEACKPCYKLFPKVDYSISFTSRGCIRKCKFCTVNKIEDFGILPNWKGEINRKKSKVIIQDNNFIATPFEHQVEVVDYISKIKHNPTVDFKSGLDAKLFTKREAKNFSRIKMPYIRFAFDNMGQDGHVQRALELARKYKAHHKSAIVYCLYNNQDKPEELYYRVKEIYKVGHSRLSHPSCAYPMRYTPLDALDRTYLGKHWTERMISTLKKIMDVNFNNWWITATALSGSDFDTLFGRTGEEFTEILEKGIVTNIKKKTTKIMEEV